MAKKADKKPAKPVVISNEFDDAKYRARHDYEMLTRAHEIKTDKERMAGVKNHAKEQAKMAEVICAKGTK